jgi:hypothetical protein
VAAVTRVRVQIERLVLDVPPDVRGEVLAEAIRAELTRLIARATPPDDIPGEAVVDVVGSPVSAGRAIAAELHARLLAEVRFPPSERDDGEVHNA